MRVWGAAIPSICGVRRLMSSGHETIVLGMVARSCGREAPNKGAGSARVGVRPVGTRFIAFLRPAAWQDGAAGQRGKGKRREQESRRL